MTKKKTISLLLAFVLACSAGLSAQDQSQAIFFIAGEIVDPGKYDLKDGMTLQNAVALAKGTTEKAALKHAVIFRQDASGEKRLEIPADLEAISQGQQEDIRLQPNDIVIVPNNRKSRPN
jgi:polysaccharide biosynthesis/export protein